MIAPAVGRNEQKKQGLGQTSSLTIVVFQRGGISGYRGQLGGGGGAQEVPVVMVYTSGSARSWGQRNQPSWSVQ